MNSEVTELRLSSVRLSIVIVNFNGMDTLPDMLASIKSYPIDLEEIIVADDGSTDGSIKWLTSDHPDVRVVAMERNTGNVSKVRNAGLQVASGTHVFLSDNDIILLPGCLHELLEVFNFAPGVFCTTPRLLDSEDRGLIYQDGNGVHFVGVGTGTNRGKTVAAIGEPPPFDTCGGGLMMLDLDRVRKIGGFDDDYLHGWGDDGELQLRGALYGYRCLHVPSAVATHRAKQHGTRRAFAQMHNRYRLMLTFYRARTLLLIIPSLLIMEIGLLLASVAGGFGNAYGRAIAATWRERRDIADMRAELQRRRRAEDSDYLRCGDLELPGAAEVGPVVRVLARGVEKLLDLNWWLVRLADRALTRPAPEMQLENQKK